MRGEPFGPLGDLLDDSVDEQMLSRVTERVRSGRRAAAAPRSMSRAVMVAVAAGALVLLAGAFVLTRALWQAPETEAGPLHMAQGPALSELANDRTEETTEHRLDDGSTITLGPQTVVSALSNTDSRVSLELRAGTATFDIAPNGPRRWSVKTHLATVEVVGTMFTVTRRADSVDVQVDRGKVRVLSQHLTGGSRDLVAGEDVEIREPQQPQATAPTPPQTRGQDVPHDGGAAPPSKAPEDGGAEATRTKLAQWRQLARGGAYTEAYQLLGSAGLQQQTKQARSIAELLALADVARLSGHPRDAVAPLEQAIASFPADGRAAVAAFTLGRIETDQLRRHGRGARAFRRCVQLGAPQAIRQDAYARMARAYARGGQYDAARAAAREYLDRYPNGRHAEELRRWIGSAQKSSPH